MSRTGYQSAARNSLLAATLAGGLLAAAIDIVYAFIAYGLYQISPTLILQSISSGILGSEAYKGGTATAAFGMTLHIAIALMMALAYTLASVRRPQLIEKPFRWGVAYGLCLYIFMNFIVLPLSAFPHPFTLPPLPLLVGVIAVHALGVGLPISLAARHYLTQANDRSGRVETE